MSLLIWLPDLKQGDKILATGPKNGILSEHSPNKHTGKAWNELNEISLINVRKHQMQTNFEPTMGSNISPVGRKWNYFWTLTQ